MSKLLGRTSQVTVAPSLSFVTVTVTVSEMEDVVHEVVKLAFVSCWRLTS